MDQSVVKKEDKERGIKLCRLFDALGDSTRFSLVQRLHKNQDICVSDLAEKVSAFATK